MPPSTTPRFVSFIMLVLVSLSVSKTFAQYSFGVRNMTIVPQRVYTNPAYIPDSRGHFGLPLLSSNHITVGTNLPAFSQILRRDANDSLFIDVQNIIDRMGKTNYLSMNVRLDLLSLSFSVGPDKNHFIYANMTQRISGRFTLPRDILDFIWRGNGAFLGENIELKKFSADASVFTEYGLSYATKFLDDQLRVGIGLNYLNGQINTSVENRGLSLFTDANNYNITAKADFTARTSGFFNDLDNLQPANIIFSGNHGFAFDIGAHWKSPDKWEAAFSFNDLGMIFWKDNVNNYELNDANFTYEGFDIASLLLSGSDSADVFGDFADTLTSVFNIEENQDSYSAGLSSNMYVSGAYNFTEKDRLALDFFGEIYRTHFEPAIAINYTRRFGHVLNLSATYMYNNRSFANLGLGFALTLGPVQWFLAVDNILAPIIPQNVKNAHFHSGLNFVFKYKDNDSASTRKGGGKKDRDGDGIVDALDVCPDEFGLLDFAGCPDTDLDSIPDKSDNCPNDFGPRANGGCPWGDQDQDGVPDNVDRCPDEPGSLDNEGCPEVENIEQETPNNIIDNKDSDGDGVFDLEDNCPETPGPIDNNGCPVIEKNPQEAPNTNTYNVDSDGDGVMDLEDDCPDIIGPIDNNGCPVIENNSQETPNTSAYDKDSDGDGVIDLEDDCPDILGPIDNKGCPVIENDSQETLNTSAYDKDSDGDGVIDLEDDCPDIIGPIDNKGCPMIENNSQETPNTSAYDKDSDGDGVMDLEDDCPDIIGPIDNNGCPEIENSPQESPKTEVYNEQSDEDGALDLAEQEVLKAASENLAFETGGDNILSSSYESLDNLAELLKSKPNYRLKISSHTDNVGSAEGNLRISEKRAKSVSQYLKNKGVDTSKFIVEWFGESKPLYPNETREGRQKNRRVEMEVVFD